MHLHFTYHTYLCMSGFMCQQHHNTRGKSAGMTALWNLISAVTFLIQLPFIWRIWLPITYIILLFHELNATKRKKGWTICTLLVRYISTASTSMYIYMYVVVCMHVCLPSSIFPTHQFFALYFFPHLFAYTLWLGFVTAVIVAWRLASVYPFKRGYGHLI